QNGQYSEAVKCFSKAISIDPYDYRPFGNRSYCYDMLRQFPKALKDADVALDLFPGWAKGHFRRGRALLGLEKYKQAEEAFKRVLDLDKDCEEAVEALFSIKVERLMQVQYAVAVGLRCQAQYNAWLAIVFSIAVSVDYFLFQRMEANSLWIGNVTSNVTEKAIMDLFKRYGTIRSVRVMHERYCAFVNYTNGEAAAKAMSALQGCEVANTKLLIKYPDHHPSNTPKAESKTSNIPLSGDKKRGPINGNECYFWRTTGCTFEDRCRFRHVPENRSVDLKP
uniref:Zgc:123010 n=1 Tax=Petromyzon marinus TaxID=7757 RepID=S4RIE8_PETMA